MDSEKSEEKQERNYGSIVSPAADNDDWLSSTWHKDGEEESDFLPPWRKRRPQGVLLVGGLFVLSLLLIVAMHGGGRESLRANVAFTGSDDVLLLSKPYESDTTCTFSNVPCHDNVCYVIPSEYEACLGRISLDVNHTLQTIRALDEIFRQYYVFYDIARDPSETWPTHHSSEAGLGLYNETNVDLHGRLESIRNDIVQRGAADVTVFWRVTEVFRALRDAHVHALQGRIGQLTSDLFSGRFILEVFPERHFNVLGDVSGRSGQMRTIFSYNTEGILGLDIQWYDMHNVTTTKSSVERIDGSTPLEFLLRLAKSPMSGTQLKSIGPRVNSLASFHFPSVRPDRTFFCSGRGSRKENVAPSSIVPDSFLVEYRDGSSERFYTRIRLSSDDYPSHEAVFEQPVHDTLELNISNIQQQANEPSCIYRNFALGTDKKFRQQASTKSRRRLSKQLEETCDISTDGWFDKSFNCSDFAPPFEDDGPLLAAYRVMDDYILFKLDSFDAPPELIKYLWKDLAKAARNASVDRLMMDLSDNGGGEVQAGLELARLMYPEVPCKMFDNKYDFVYNEPMHAWATHVQPLLTDLKAAWLDARSKESRPAHLHSLSHNGRKRMTDAAKAMCILSLDHDQSYCGDADIVEHNCTLLVSARRFQANPSKESLSDFLAVFFANITDINPWTLAASFGVPISTKYKAYKRGGKVEHFSRPIGHDPDENWWYCSKTLTRGASPFSAYVLVDNGNSGSTAHTFQSTVEEIWKNRDQSGATRSLVTVSYGGIPGDTPLTQFAGGTVVDRVNIEDSFFGLAGLHLLSILLKDSKHSERAKEAISLLERTLPNVPYYLQDFPRVTGVEIYNRFVLRKIPLEYVKMDPDTHIPQMYFGSIFHRPEGLEKLYDEASRMFDVQ